MGQQWDATLFICDEFSPRFCCKETGSVPFHFYQSLVTEDLYPVIKENKPAVRRTTLKQVGETQWRLQKTETE